MLSYLNTILEGQNFVAGSHLTIADFSIVTSITGIYVRLQNYAPNASFYQIHL